MPLISCSKVLWSITVAAVKLRILAAIFVPRALLEPLPEVKACDKAVDDLSSEKDRNIRTIGT